MTREQSLQVKGIAILMMLYVHLFHSSENAGLCSWWLQYGSVPLFQKLTRCATPVPMFLIVSGYGFMKALLDGRKSGKTRLQRALNLYIPYWVVNVFMCIIALLAVPVAGDCGLDLGVKPLVYNVVALETSYNPYCWFVLPYVLLAVFSRPLCLFVKRNKAVAVVAVGLVCHILSYAALDSWASFLSANPLLMLVANLIYLMFPFLLGTLFAKYSWKAPQWFGNAWFGRHESLFFFVCLLLLVFAKLHFPGTVNPLFAIVFVFFFVRTRPVPVVTPLLKLFGRHSLGMWFVHYWLLNVFLHDRLFALRYPIVIFAALILASLLLSVVFERMWTAVERIVNVRRNTSKAE